MKTNDTRALMVDIGYKFLAMFVAIVFCSSCTSTRAISTPLCVITWGSTDGLSDVNTLPTNDGVYVYGNSTDAYTGAGIGGDEQQSDVWLSKYDINAQLIWSKKIGTDQVDKVNQAVILATGDIVLVGLTSGSLYGTNTGGANVFVVSYSPSGVLRWTKQLPTANCIDVSTVLSNDNVNVSIVDNNSSARIVQISSAGSVLQNNSLDSVTHPSGSCVKYAFYNGYGTLNYLYNTDTSSVGTADLSYVYHDSLGAEHTVAIPYTQGASVCAGQPDHYADLTSYSLSPSANGVNIFTNTDFNHKHSNGCYTTQIVSTINVTNDGIVNVNTTDENKAVNVASPSQDTSGSVWTGWSRVGKVFNESTSMENFVLYGLNNDEYYDNLSSYKVIQYAPNLASKVFEGDVAVNLPSGVTPTSGQLVRVGATLFWVAPVYKTVNDVDQFGVMVYKFDSIATPVYSLASGTYTGTQNVSISCTTTGAQIRYTTDGSEPTETSALYSGPISVSMNKTIKARAFVTGMVPSARADASYVIRKTISGALTLKMYSGNKNGLVATIVLRKPDGTVLQTSSAVLDSSGNYSLLTEYEGTMEMLVRVPRWLRKKASINVAGNVTSNFTLTNGDADANNSVNLFDYTVLDCAYGTRPGDAGWNQMADLDGGNTVDSFDYMIEDMYFGQTGDN